MQGSSGWMASELEPETLAVVPTIKEVDLRKGERDTSVEGCRMFQP